MGALVAASVAFPAHRRALPPPPVLEAFNGKWHTDSYLVEGTVDSLRFLGYVRLYRNGAVVDSVTTTLSKSFAFHAALEPGENLFTAVQRDSAFNESGLSNTVRVVFDTRAGLFVPIPFAPGRSFDLNSDETAAGAQVRVYDVAGELVVKFESREARTFYSFPWDGRNASGENVRRGPLVAVTTMDFADGTHEVIRRVFLFDPEASP